MNVCLLIGKWCKYERITVSLIRWSILNVSWDKAQEQSLNKCENCHFHVSWTVKIYSLWRSTQGVLFNICFLAGSVRLRILWKWKMYKLPASFCFKSSLFDCSKKVKFTLNSFGSIISMTDWKIDLTRVAGNNRSLSNLNLFWWPADPI